MNRQIFRKEAIERLSSPEQLDLLMPITSGRGWIALAGVGLLLLIGVLWAIYGSVETTVEGRGLLMRNAGFHWAWAPQDGEVAEVLVDPDDTVKPDDELLTFFRPESGDRPPPVKSPCAGRVLEVTVIKGSTVRKGDWLVSIETPEAPLQAAVYVSADNGFKIQPHMPVRVVPRTTTDEGSSQLTGRVESIGRFPVTQSQILHSLQNEKWANDFIAMGPTLEVMVDIPSDRPLTELYSGTPCDASIIVAQRRPIEFLLPIAGN